MTHSRMSILMVTAWSPARVTGGVSTMIATLSRELSKNHDVHILVDVWDARRLRSDRSDDLAIYLLRLRPPYDATYPVKGFFGWLKDLPRTLMELRKLIRSQKVDVVHLHFASSYQFCFRIMRMLGGPPYVVTLHRGDTVNFPSQSMVDRFLVRRTLAGAGRVVAVSAWLARLGEKTFPGCGKIICVHNGLDLLGSLDDSKTPNQDSLAETLPARFFVNVANVTYYKGQDVAIRAWAQVRQRCPDLHLVIVGARREHWETCEELIRTLGQEDSVHMLGPLPRGDVFAVMEHAMGMVFPSRSEGHPLALLEAGAMSLPTICSDIPPLREIVDSEESGILIRSEDPDALAEAVVRLAEDVVLRGRLGRALHDKVAAEFTAEHMARRYVEIYRELSQL